MGFIFSSNQKLISPYQFCFLYWSILFLLKGRFSVQFFFTHIYIQPFSYSCMTKYYLLLIKYYLLLIKTGDGKTWKNSEYITKNHATEGETLLISDFQEHKLHAWEKCVDKIPSQEKNGGHFTIMNEKIMKRSLLISVKMLLYSPNILVFLISETLHNGKRRIREPQN